MNHWDVVGELARQHHVQLDDEGARDGLARSVRTSNGVRPSRLGTLWVAIRGLARRDPPLTDLACRLPDGRVGRLRIVEQQGEWVLVCRTS